MTWNKIFQRATITLLIFINLFSMSTANAEVQTYEGFGEYFMKDETVDFAKAQAELIAQRDLLEKISVYIKSQSTMTDNELENDEIITISAGILRVTETKFFLTDDGNVIIVKSFVTAQIDTDELKKLLEEAIKKTTRSND